MLTDPKDKPKLVALVSYHFILLRFIPHQHQNRYYVYCTVSMGESNENIMLTDPRDKPKLVALVSSHFILLRFISHQHQNRYYVYCTVSMGHSDE